MITEIVPVTEEYIDACAGLMAQPELVTSEGKFISKIWLTILQKSNLSYLIISGGQVLGCIFGEIENDVCSLHLIAVNPNYHHLGLGAKLMVYFEERCKEVGVSKIVLFSTTKSQRNYDFYIKCGYTNVNIVEEKDSTAGSFYTFEKNLSK